MSGARLRRTVGWALACVSCSPSPGAEADGADTEASSSDASAEESAEGSEAGSGEDADASGADAGDGGDTGEDGPRPDLPQPGDPVFVDVTEEAGLDAIQAERREPPDCLFDDQQFGGGEGAFCDPERYSGGVAVGDVDRDGWPDVLLTGVDGGLHLYWNRGDGTFEETTASAGLDADARTNGAAFGDVDRDGDLDLYVTTLLEPSFLLYINAGDGTFTEESLMRDAGIEHGGTRSGMSVVFVDVDRDGWLDVHTNEWLPIANHDSSFPWNTRLLRNRGPEAPGAFEDITDASGASIVNQENMANYGFCSFVEDLDLDGWPDLWLTGDFGRSRLLFGSGAATFEDGTGAAGVGTDKTGMGTAVGDIDGDGWLDVFVTAISGSELCDMFGCDWDGNRLYRNRGDGTFEDWTDALGVRNGGWGWGSVFIDFDHDGDLDLVAATGNRNPVSALLSMYFGEDPIRLWEHPGVEALPSAFEERAAVFALNDLEEGRALVPIDYDRDGDLDLLMTRHADTPRLYRNDVATAAWVQVALVGTSSAPDGRGARVAVQAQAGGDWQLRAIGLDSVFLGHGELIADFAAVGESVAAIEVCWPSGLAQRLENVEANQRLTLNEDDAQPLPGGDCASVRPWLGG